MVARAISSSLYSKRYRRLIATYSYQHDLQRRYISPSVRFMKVKRAEIDRSHCLGLAFPALPHKSKQSSSTTYSLGQDICPHLPLPVSLPFVSPGNPLPF